MGLWVSRPKLHDDENVRWTKNANRQQDELRAVGGRLFLTNRRLLFQPNRFDSITGGRTWSTPIDNIVDVAVHAREADVPLMGKAAKLRRRLQIETPEGNELFVVNDVDGAVAQLQQLV